MQFLERIDLRFVHLSGNEGQRVLVSALGQVPVHRIVAKVGLSPDEPLRERRPGIVQHFLEGFVPVNELGLLTPEGFWLFNGATMKLLILCIHDFSSSDMRVLLHKMLRNPVSLRNIFCNRTGLLTWRTP